MKPVCKGNVSKQESVTRGRTIRIIDNDVQGRSKVSLKASLKRHRVRTSQFMSGNRSNKEGHSLLAISDSALDTALLPALCVDLDGTLVKSDTLVDSALVLARYHPALLLQIPSWLLQGKA